jgi:hypothetical protein
MRDPLKLVTKGIAVGELSEANRQNPIICSEIWQIKEDIQRLPRNTAFESPFSDYKI